MFFCNGQQVIDHIKNVLDNNDLWQKNIISDYPAHHFQDESAEHNLKIYQPIATLILDFQMPYKNGIQVA